MRTIVAMLLLLSAPGMASAQTSTYRGAHPVDLEGHWHSVEGDHEHGELLVGAGPFAESHGTRFFLADPLAYGFDGAVWTFRGAHPLPGAVEAYCGVSGEHRHPFAPEGTFRTTSSGAHVYIGAMRGGRPMLRPARTAPRRAVVVPPAMSSPGPYLFWGCQYQLLRGARGSFVPTPLVTGCVPRGGSSVAGTRGARAPSGSPGPPPRGSWFDGNYTRTYSNPTRGSRPAPPSTQRR